MGIWFLSFSCTPAAQCHSCVFSLRINLSFLIFWAAKRAIDSYGAPQEPHAIRVCLVSLMASRLHTHGMGLLVHGIPFLSLPHFHQTPQQILIPGVNLCLPLFYFCTFIRETNFLCYTRWRPDRNLQIQMWQNRDFYANKLSVLLRTSNVPEINKKAKHLR